MATDEHALLLDFGYNLARLEKQQAKMLSMIDGNAKQAEARVQKMGERMEASLGHVDLGKFFTKTFDRSRLAVIEEGGAKIGVFGSAIEALGPAGLAAAAGVAAVAAAFEETRKAMEFGDAIDDAATKLGISTDALQEFRFALEETGGKAEDADVAIQSFTQQLGLAENGSKKALKYFEALGFTQAQLKSFGSADEALKAVADRVAGLSDEASKAAIAEKLGLTPMLPLLRHGAEAMDDLRAEAHQLGYVMDADVVRTMSEANDKFEAAAKVVDVQFKSAFVNLVPVLMQVMGLIADLARETNDFFDGFKKLEDRQRQSIVDDRGHALKAMTAISMNPNSYYNKDGRRVMTPSAQNAYDTYQKQYGLDDLELKNRDAAYPDIKVGPSAGGHLNDLGAGGKRGARGPKKGDLVLMHGGPQDKEGRGYWVVFGDPDAPIVTENDAREMRTADTSKAVDLTTGLGSDVKDKQPGVTFGENAAEGMRQGFEEHQAELQDFWYDITRGGLEAAIHKGWPGVVEYMAQKLEARMLDVIAKMATNWLAAQSQSSPGGIFAGIASFFSIGANADGTDFWRGGPTWVGERGPEIVNLPRGAQVVPNSALRNLSVPAGGGAGAMVQHFSVHVDAKDAVLAETVKTWVGEGMQRAIGLSVSHTETRLKQQQQTRHNTMGLGRRP